MNPSDDFPIKKLRFFIPLESLRNKLAHNKLKISFVCLALYFLTNQTEFKIRKFVTKKFRTVIERAFAIKNRT